MAWPVAIVGYLAGRAMVEYRDLSTVTQAIAATTHCQPLPPPHILTASIIDAKIWAHHPADALSIGRAGQSDADRTDFGGL